SSDPTKRQTATTPTPPRRDLRPAVSAPRRHRTALPDSTPHVSSTTHLRAQRRCTKWWTPMHPLADAARPLAVRCTNGEPTQAPHRPWPPVGGRPHRPVRDALVAFGGARGAPARPALTTRAGGPQGAPQPSPTGGSAPTCAHSAADMARTCSVRRVFSAKS